ncbi:MAG TPA: Ig-like domain-containing protein [Gaiellaceae bacterium]|nr:Ig-like domain-containing protein [Gaiellaceae bacterium]
MLRRARLVTLTLLALLAFAAFAGARADRAGAVSADLFISEYVEGSSFNKAIEIYNGTGVAVNLTTGLYGISQYSNGDPAPTFTINLNGTIAPGDVFVLAHTSADPAIRAQADQLSSLGLFNGNDAVALRKGIATVDVIGQIGVNPGDAGWGTDPTNTTDNTLRRKPTIEAGDPNGGDAFDPAVEWDGFAVNTFGGLGSHTVTTGGDASPSVASSSPANGATEVAQGANITVNFSEAVTAAAGWYTISCGTSGAHTATQSGGPQSYTLDPDTDFAEGETCTVTIDASKVTDNDLDDPPDAMAANHSFSFTTTLPVTQIAGVQGAAHISPLNGQRVKVEGVVTARRTAGGRGYWIQDPTPDSDLATSDAVFVFLGQVPAAQIGSQVRVVGTVGEFRAGTPPDPDNLTITQVNSSNANVTVLSSGNPAPAATVLGLGGRTPPTENIDDDGAGNVETGGVFDPDGDAIDFYESLEGMILQVNDGSVVGPTRSFGEITLLPDRGSWATGLRTPRGGILLGGYTDPNPERIIVDDEILRDLAPTPRPAKAMPDMNVGDQLTSSVVGPLDYSFSNYKIQATTTPTFDSGGNVRESAELPRAEEVVFGTFNVENLAGTDPQAKFDHLASLIVNNLQAPDVLGIEEVQDNDGVFDPPGPGLPTDSTVVDADVAWTRLIAAIEGAGGPTYDYRQINPVDDADGGAPGGNIRVGFLFRTDRGISFVDRPGGSPTTETTVVGKKHKPELSSSPGRIGTESAAFADTRKSLVAEFNVRDRTVFAIVNHFSSKGDDQPLFGPAQPPTRFSEIARHVQAQVVNDFVDEILARDDAAKIVVLGDINDFEFSETTDILEGGVLTSLVKTLPENERYSYVFEGNSQVLDQILISDRLLELPYRPAYDVVHVNSEFADAIQASDHEPSVVHLKFGVEED